MENLLLYFFIIGASILLTELIRRYTIKNNFLDQPNERSSHSTATPRGGGASFAIIFLIVVGYSDLLPINLVFAIIGAGTLVAGIGFWDDHGHIPAKWRLLSHFVAAFWALYWLGKPPLLQILGLNLDMGWLGVVLIALLLVWLLNLFNFMDGIDGIAASETIFVSYAAAYFSWVNGLESYYFVLMLLASSATGFLILNWPPAKIFMGDVGSGFLGLMIGVIAYASILEGYPVLIWVVLLGVFLVDSSVTLIRRILKGEKWYEAHCIHAYQYAAKKWGHKPVTLSVILINVLWLFPLAFILNSNPDFNVSLLIVFIAYIPLIIIAFKLKAGITGDNKK